jgi:hypothetical protein
MSKRPRVEPPARGDHWHAVWDALDKVVQAWEVLPGGQRHSPKMVEMWLTKYMSPAINNARRALGRETTDGS